jgi:hypothetical protein
MDYKNAKEKLSELRDSLNEVLGSKTEGPSREARQAKKTFLSKVKDFPVVDKITQLGAAGTVAVGTAAVTQTNIAVNETEVFVASVANDVVHERLRFPPIINNFVDFGALDTWGQQVMREKVAEVKAEAAKVEAKVAPAKSQPTKETNSQEPQAQEESADNSKENGGNAEGAKQDTEEVESEEIESEEVQETQEEEIAQPVPEENSEESVDEIDEIKPHSEVESILPDDSIVVSPAGPRQA